MTSRKCALAVGLLFGLARAAFGVLVEVNNHDATDAAYGGLFNQMQFVPLSCPQRISNITIWPTTVVVKLTNGPNRVKLVGGLYMSGIVGDTGKGKTVLILAPPNDTNVWQFNDCANLATNLGTFVWTNLVTVGTFTGNGAGITNLDGANLQAGTVSTNALNAGLLALLVSGGGGTATNIPPGIITNGQSGVTLSGVFSGTLTDINIPVPSGAGSFGHWLDAPSASSVSINQTNLSINALWIQGAETGPGSGTYYRFAVAGFNPTLYCNGAEYLDGNPHLYDIATDQSFAMLGIGMDVARGIAEVAYDPAQSLLEGYTRSPFDFSYTNAAAPQGYMQARWLASGRLDSWNRWGWHDLNPRIVLQESSPDGTNVFGLDVRSGMMILGGTRLGVPDAYHTSESGMVQSYQTQLVAGIVIDTNGWVGIGHTNPLARPGATLDVGGAVLAGSVTATTFSGALNGNATSSSGGWPTNWDFASSITGKPAFATNTAAGIAAAQGFASQPASATLSNVTAHVTVNGSGDIVTTGSVISGGVLQGNGIGVTNVDPGTLSRPVSNGTALTNVPLSGLQTNGATAGQVPTFRGTNVSWVTPAGGSGGSSTVTADALASPVGMNLPLLQYGAGVISDGTNLLFLDHSRYQWFYDDFPNAATGDLIWRNGVANGGAIAANGSSIFSPSSCDLRINCASNSSYAYIRLAAGPGSSSVAHGAGSSEFLTFRVLTPIAPVADATNVYNFIIGFHNTENQLPPTDGIYFQAGPTNANWQVVFSVSSVRYTNDTSVVVATNGWQNLSLLWDANTNVTAYINGLPVLTNTDQAQMSTSSALAPGARAATVGSAGANSSRDFLVDYFWLIQKFGTPR